MLKPGNVVLAKVQFTDTFEVKKRPTLILFEEFGNVVVAGVTSNKKMKGVPISKEEGALKDCVVKLNYIFTLSEEMVEKKLFSLSKKKRKLVFDKLVNKLKELPA